MTVQLLVLTWPYALIFWTVFVLAFLPESRIVFSLVRFPSRMVTRRRAAERATGAYDITGFVLKSGLASGASRFAPSKEVALQ